MTVPLLAIASSTQQPRRRKPAIPAKYRLAVATRNLFGYHPTPLFPKLSPVFSHRYKVTQARAQNKMAFKYRSRTTLGQTKQPRHISTLLPPSVDSAGRVGIGSESYRTVRFTMPEAVIGPEVPVMVMV